MEAVELGTLTALLLGAGKALTMCGISRNYIPLMLMVLGGASYCAITSWTSGNVVAGLAFGVNQGLAAVGLHQLSKTPERMKENGTKIFREKSAKSD